MKREYTYYQVDIASNHFRVYRVYTENGHHLADREFLFLEGEPLIIWRNYESDDEWGWTDWRKGFTEKGQVITIIDRKTVMNEVYKKILSDGSTK